MMKAVDSTLWRLPAGLAEDVNRRTQHSKEFTSPGDSRSRVSVISSNLHYEARPGEWEPQAYGFRLRGGDHVADRHWFATRISDSGLSIVDRVTGLGVRWITPGRPAILGRLASLAGDGVSWSWSVGPKRLKLQGLVVAPLGARTYAFQYQPLGGGSDFRIVNGAAVAPGVVVAKPIVFGANRQVYPTRGWRLVAGPRLAFDFDDTRLPPEAYPYVIDPTTTLRPGGAAGLDALMYANSSGDNFGSSAGMEMGDNNPSANGVSRSIFGFDMTSISTGVTVSSAVISLFEYQVEGPAGAGQVDLHRVRRDWVESEVTYDDWKSANAWTAGGADDTTDDRLATVSASQTLGSPTSTAYNDWGSTGQLISDASDMIDNPGTNYGWVTVSANENSGATRNQNTVRTSEHSTEAQRPRLVIIHSAPTVSPTGSMATQLHAAGIM